MKNPHRPAIPQYLSMVPMASFKPTALLAAGLLLTLTSALDVDRTLTPPMGWNSYNHYSCYATETVIKANADALVSLGLADVGYNYVVPDCGWTAKERTADGKITWNETFYPSGYPALIEYVHNKGLKFGIYSGAGTWQCHPEAGNGYHIQASLGHEQIDAETFAAWGGDYLKYDNCWADGVNNVVYFPNEDPSTRFKTMANALDTVSRDIVYAICQWGIGDNLPEWAGPIGNSWRMSNDIVNNWISIFRITNQVVPLSKYTSTGHYNDMDMLMIGNGVLTEEEAKTHFTIWCVEKSLLMIGAGLEENLLDPVALKILSNKELVAINQDSLGQAAKLMRRFTLEQYDVWAGNLSDARTVLMVINWAPVAKTVTINLADAGISSAVKARDVWAASDLGALDGVYSASLAGHGVKLLVLEQTTPAGTYINPKYTSSNTTTAFTNVYALTSSTYNIAVTSSARSTAARTITVIAGNTRRTVSVTGTTYTIPAFPLPAGQNTLRIQDSTGTIKTIKTTLATASVYYSAQTAALAGGASLNKCADADGCKPTNYKVGNLAVGSAMTFNGVSGGTVAGSKWVWFDYINYDLAFDRAWDGSGTNVRNATFAVNGGTPKMWSFPISGGDWQDTGRMGVLLDGFVAGSGNTLVVGAPGWEYAPDVVGVEVLA